MKFNFPRNKMFMIALPLCMFGLSIAFLQNVRADQQAPESGITATPEIKMAPEFEEGDIHKALENDVTIQTTDGEQHKFSVELAIRPDEQEKGLMFRENMPEDHGMLFVFRTVQPRTFWMKNTLIPLDIIFLEPDGRIQHIHSRARPQDLSFITSGKPSKAVLELNGGATDRLGIKAGDTVHHSAFRNLNRLDN